MNKISLLCFDDKIRLLVFTKTLKSRFSQMIIKKEILTDNHERFSQINTNAHRWR